MARERSRWIRATLGAVLAVPVSLAALLGLAAVAGDQVSGDAMFLLVAGTPFCLIIALVAWITGRGRIAGAVLLGLLATAHLALGSIEALLRPQRFFGFAASVVLLAAPIVAVIAAVRPDAAAWRRVVQAVTALGAVAIGGSAVAFLLAGPVQLRDGDVVTVVTAADHFYPSSFAGPAGADVTFRLVNDDGYAHTFSVDEFEVDTYMGPDADRKVTAKLDGNGVLRLYCAINGHEAMVGTIDVGPGVP